MSENDTLPEQAVEFLNDEEVENLRNRDGWATGTVVHVEDGEEAERFEDAAIELFNGAGRAGQFDGARFMWGDDEDEYEEAYCYTSEEQFEASGKDAAYYVAEYDDPEDPDVGPVKRPEAAN